MRILFASDLWLDFPGGAERLQGNVARDLMARGHAVQVVTGYEHATQGDGPPVCIDLDLPLTPEGAERLHHHIAVFRPDVIVSHHVWAREFAHVFGPWPWVQFVLNGKREPGADLAVYISKYVMGQHNDAKPQDFLLTPFANSDVIAHDGLRDAIGFIKPLPHKGAAFFYKIAKHMPDRQFVVLRGEWQDLELIERLPNVAFMEPVKDIRDFWGRCRIVLVPSLSEDAGTVAQEATVNRVPCISSLAGGLPETNGGGIRLPTTRVAKWVNAIKKLDNASYYQDVCDQQTKYYDATNHAGWLDLLAQKIEALPSTR